MTQIQNKTSKILITIVLAAAGVFFSLAFPQKNRPILTMIVAIIATYLSIWIIYYFLFYLLKIVKVSEVKKKTELLNTLLTISIINFILLYSNFVIEWDTRLLSIVSHLTTALGYFYFSNKIEKTTPAVATVFSLIIIFVETLLVP
jgi:hypothetical protein